MVKLSDDATHEAWEEFKVFVGQIGLVDNITGLNDAQRIARRDGQFNKLQLAFKHGFVEGARYAKEQAAFIPMVDFDFEEVDEEPEPDKKHRVVTGRKVRTHEQRQRDNKAVETLLKFSASGEAVPLSWILANMNQRHFDHWNNGNASGFVAQAIKDGTAIAKVSTGFYRYTGNDTLPAVEKEAGE